MLKPVCVPCHRFFRQKKSGFYFIEGMPTIPGAKPGSSDPESWQPYKLWSGDLWECQGCGAEIISGVGFRSISQHYQEDFKELVEKLNAEYQVNDC